MLSFSYISPRCRRLGGARELGFFFSLVANFLFVSIASGVALVLGASSLWFFTVTYSPFFAVLYALYSTNPFSYTHLHRRCFGTFTRTKGFGTHHPHKKTIHPSKRGLETSSHHHQLLNRSKEPPKHPKNPPETKQKCPPSAP